MGYLKVEQRQFCAKALFFLYRAKGVEAMRDRPHVGERSPVQVRRELAYVERETCIVIKCLTHVRREIHTVVIKGPKD